VPGLALIDRLRHPTQLVLAAFTGLIIIGSALLRLPFAFEGPHPGFVDALFTSTSAVTVTGLATFDIERLSLFGELVVLALVQIGGFGIMTIGSVLGLVASRRVGLRQRMLAHTEIGGVELGQVRSLLSAIARITIAVEASLAVVLFLRLWQSDAEPVGRAAYSGVFHAVTAFNNAGFSLYSDSLRRFVGDAWICMPISLGIIIGGLGFPILVELERRCPPPQWSLHARITLGATVLLLVVAPLIVLIFEWTNPATLGELSGGDKVLAGWFQGVTPRTAGFETVPYGEMNEPTQTVTAALMFVGAGPASTSGGIKVTTFAVLFFILLTEFRGEGAVNIFGKRLSRAVHRQAITVVLVAVGAVMFATVVLMHLTGLAFDRVVFEAVSAFATVGLSTGITYDLPPAAEVVLVLLMFLGRIGPLTLGSAIALRDRRILYELPKERPAIG
jgi:trk system potassium uptake protein TrkH